MISDVKNRNKKTSYSMHMLRTFPQCSSDQQSQKYSVKITVLSLTEGASEFRNEALLDIP